MDFKRKAYGVKLKDLQVGGIQDLLYALRFKMIRIFLLRVEDGSGE
jgi:hypothetical protein